MRTRCQISVYSEEKISVSGEDKVSDCQISVYSEEKISLSGEDKVSDISIM